MRFESKVIICLYFAFILSLFGAYLIARKYSPKVELSWTLPSVKTPENVHVLDMRIEDDKLIMVLDNGKYIQLDLPSQVVLSSLPDILLCILVISLFFGGLTVAGIVCSIEEEKPQ